MKLELIFTALTEILWTVFASGAENRNEMLLWLKEAGGITNVFKGFKNVAIALLTLLKPISEAFDQIFSSENERTMAWDDENHLENLPINY